MKFSHKSPPKTAHTVLLSQGDFLDMQDQAQALQGQCAKHQHVVLNFSKVHHQCKEAFINIISKAVFNLSYKRDHADRPEPVFYIMDRVKYTQFWHDTLSKIHCGDIARTFASEPSNVLYPSAFAKRTQELFKDLPNVSVSIFDEKKLKSMGFGLVLGVGAGSAHPPCFITLEVDLGSGRTIALCGKGVCFDSGGYNLKHDGGIGMHTDKLGGAVVVGLVHYLACHGRKLGLTGKVVGLIPLVENMINGHAIKPSDILTAYNKKTVEVLNTDAEGRLILADALAYAVEEFKPDVVLDFATLTGWASDIFCDSSFVYYTCNESFAHKLEAVSERVGERIIRMAKWPEYIRYTKSTVADYKNVGFRCGATGSRAGSGFMAAMFLSNFLPPKLRCKWVHFDITHAHSIGNAPLSNANSFYTALHLVTDLLKQQK